MSEITLRRLGFAGSEQIIKEEVVGSELNNVKFRELSVNELFALFVEEMKRELHLVAVENNLEHQHYLSFRAEKCCRNPNGCQQSIWVN